MKEEKKKIPKWVKIVLIVFVVIVIIGILGNTDNSSNTSSNNENSNMTTTANATTTTSTENNVPTEYKNALKKAENYSKIMHMSKQGIYDQLTSEYGEKFTAEEAQYAIDNLD